MKKIIRQILLFCFTLLIYSSSCAQTGPGGVGNSTSNIVWLDGSDSYSATLQTGTLITPNGCFAIGGEQDAIDGGYTAGQAHAGDFAEVIVYNVSLNEAQRILVANYLAV